MEHNMSKYQITEKKRISWKKTAQNIFEQLKREIEKLDAQCKTWVAHAQGLKDFYNLSEKIATLKTRWSEIRKNNSPLLQTHLNKIAPEIDNFDGLYWAQVARDIKAGHFEEAIDNIFSEMETNVFITNTLIQLLDII